MEAFAASNWSVAAHDLRTAVLVVLAIAFILFRLMRRHTVAVGFLVAVPLILGYFGLSDLREDKDALAVGLLAACLLLEFGVGLLLGRTYTMWREGADEVWSQGRKSTIGLWVVAFGLRVVFIAIAQATGATVTESAEILLSIAAVFVGQNLVIAKRAGIFPSLRPEAPPPDAHQL